MKLYWQRIVLKIDALTLRERVIVFALAVVVLVTFVNAMLLDPQSVKQKQLSAKVKGDRAKIAAIQSEIQQKAQLQSADPDSDTRESLTRLKQQSAQMHASLIGMQKQLVSPDKMADLLESLLRQNGQLRLVSLKTLPVTTLNEVAAGDRAEEKTTGASVKDKPAMNEAVYRHGVEITVQGSYGELLNYLTELEAKPWQLFWGKARLNAEEYPKVTLTLTLFTLSLDKKWLNI